MKIEQFFESESQNIVNLIDEQRLEEIYMEVKERYRSDLSAMGDKIDKIRSYVKLASLISERIKPFENASDVVFPLAGMACIQFGSTAYQALFPDDDIAKVKVIGSDEGKLALNDKGIPIVKQDGSPLYNFVGAKAEIGKRIATAINYQLTEEMEYWKIDAITSMYRLPALGTLFKKTYWDFIRDKSCSKFIDPDKIILHPSISCIDNNVWSEIIDLDKKSVTSNMKLGLWKEIELQEELSYGNDKLALDEDKPSTPLEDRYRFIEQHTFLDLDDDGLEEPYCVVFSQNAGKILRITPDYDLENVKRKNGKIFFIERNECLTSFGFLPSFSGGIYSVGYAELLQNSNAAVNATINQMIDAASLKLKGGGFISTGIDLRGGSMTMKMGEYKKVNSAGGNLAANVFPFPFPEPSPSIFALLQLLIESGKEIGSLRDVLTGDTAANMAPTTYMGLVEQGMKQALAVIKNIHESFKKEIKIIRKLNAKYLSNDKYAMIIDNPNPLDVSAKQDFSTRNLDIVLVTDSSAITSAQKFAQAQMLLTLKDDPFYNPLELRRMFNEAIQMPKLNDIIAPPPPTPDANLVLAQAEDKKADAKLAETQIRSDETNAKIAEMAEKLQLMYSEIKVNESEALKNIAEAFTKDRELRVKELSSMEKAITDRINASINARSIEIQHEMKNESKKEESNQMDE